jgi:hypothetical protein
LQGFNRHLARQGRVNAGMRLANSATSLSPVIPTAVMMARAINPAIRLYSIAVAADSSRKNFRSIDFLSNFDGNVVARPSCRQDNQKRKIAGISAFRASWQGGVIHRV